MRIHNIYSDEDGETHFRDIDIEMSQVGPDGTTLKGYPLQEFISEPRQPIGFSIGSRQRDASMSST